MFAQCFDLFVIPTKWLSGYIFYIEFNQNDFFGITKMLQRVYCIDRSVYNGPWLGLVFGSMIYTNLFG